MQLGKVKRFQAHPAELETSVAVAAEPLPNAPKRVLFAYWGRRGALARLTLDLTRVACASPKLIPLISVSRQNELFSSFEQFGSNLLAVDTFSSRLGAANVARLMRLRRKVSQAIVSRGIETVIMMMPHVWGPAITPTLLGMGRRYALVVHDAIPHPGDPTTKLNGWMLRDVANASCVVTLSETVARRLSETCRIPSHKIVKLFHPDLSYGEPLTPTFPQPGEPLKLLFFGRILPYKGLPILVDAAERLRRRGVRFKISVYGEGDLQPISDRLRQLGAEIVNKWIPDAEVANVFARHHVVVLAHTEASQSGIIASAHGLGLPVIATAVGALPEQIQDGVTGILAERADDASLAAAIERLALSPELYRRIVAGIAATRPQRAMERFVSELVTHACREPR